MRVLLVIALLFVGAPEVAAQPGGACAEPAGVYRDPATWAQRFTDPAGIWPLSDGTGQLVAVIGTGVDAGNAQFAPGRVVAGSDAADCDGRGTFAAGIVAARPDPATTFAGMAPGARLLGVLYTQTTTGGGGNSTGDADLLAGAVDRAVQAGATVILVAVPTMASSPRLAGAVANALASGVVVVSPVVGDKPGVRSYPAALPGVVGVGAIDEAGVPQQAEEGEHVLISAPGVGVVSTAAGVRGVGHLWGAEFPGVAAGAYVAGTVALMRAYRPGLTVADVTSRLVATASRGRVLDVNAAVTAELVGENGAPKLRATTVVPAAAPAEPPVRAKLPGWLGMLGVVLAVLAVVSVAVVRRARR